MNTSDQPIFELEMLVVRQAIIKETGLKPDVKIFAWDTLYSLGIDAENFYSLIKAIDLTPFQGKEPIPEVTLEDVEFIFYDKHWPNETVGALAAKLGSLVSYKKSLKDTNPEYAKNKKVLENYKEWMENQKKDPV